MPDEPGEATPSRGGGNPLTRKLGPIPVWGWIAAVGVGVAVFVIRKKAQTAASAATAAPTAPTAAPGTTAGASGYSSGQNLGGYDSASADSMLQHFQDQLTAVQSGVQLNPTGVGQVQGVVSTTAPPPAQAPTATAPVQAANPIAAAIESQYQTQLGRASDPAGLAFWESQYQANPAQEQAAFAAAAAKERGTPR